MKRLITQGSLSFLLSRPFVIGFRALRRHLKTPYWKNPPPPRPQYRHEVLADEIDLSVIVVTYKAERLIVNCLDSLFEECRDLRLEVFVVDSGSSDHTVNVVRERFPTVRLHASPLNIGFSAGNNIALPQARGRYIALLNPDTIVHKDAFKCLMRYLDQHPRAGAVGPTLRLANGDIQVECARNLPSIGNLFPWLLLLDKVEWMLRFRQKPKDTNSHRPRKTICDRYSLLSWPRDRTCEVESICGACMMIRREVIEQIGVLDETTPLYLDDIDYCRRIREAGWSIHYVAESTITHLWQQSSSNFERDGDFYAMGMHSTWLYLRKHDGRLASMAFSVMACVASPIRVLVCAAASALSGGQRKRFWKRQLNMALGLSR